MDNKRHFAQTSLPQFLWTEEVTYPWPTDNVLTKQNEAKQATNTQVKNWRVLCSKTSKKGLFRWTYFRHYFYPPIPASIPW